jgi:hypothetical protein
MSWIHKLFLGEDPEADQARAAEADRRLAELNQQKRETYGEDWFAQTEANLERGRVENAEADVNQAFSDGWNEGVANIREGIGDTVSLPFRLIPWQVWGLAAVALFVWAGGLQLLQGRLVKR